MSESVNPLPEDLEVIALEIAVGIRRSLEQLTEGWYQRMASIPQLVSWRRPEVRAIVLPHARIDIGRELEGLVNGRKLPSTCPAEVVESARLAAANGLPLWAALQAYRTGHAEQWQAWNDAIEGREMGPADRRALLRAGSDYFFGYGDRCMRWMEMEYQSAREMPMRREEQRRVQLVRRLLDGRDGDATELGYDLSQWHIGLIASGEGVESLIDATVKQYGTSTLAVAAEASAAWLWIGMEVAPTEIQSWLSALDPPEGGTLGVGEPAHGRRGFGLTHAQAQIAAGIGQRLGQATTLYEDVALEDLTGYDPQRAQQFIERELGALLADTREARVLRETLSAYFACAQRASSAAVQLDVHERTVGNRLRRAERLLGGSVSRRHTEIEVALRLHALITPP